MKNISIYTLVVHFFLTIILITPCLGNAGNVIGEQRKIIDEISRVPVRVRMPVWTEELGYVPLH